MKAMNISENLRNAILQVWGGVGDEVVSLCEEAGEECTNEIAIETCIDADRILGVARNEEAHMELKQLLGSYGYDKVLTGISKQITLC